ncbi:MAG: hypothetical protein GX317_04035, partial [Staphylococcus equorum]|nr:hypothetical protein [Staphylococcus equorum]
MTQDKRSGRIWYDKDYANTLQEVQVIVYDTEENGADDVQIINVLPPTIDARMQIDGALKVNRKITLKDISNTPDSYNTISRKWTVAPVTSSGTTASDIKHNGDWTSSSEELLFKKAGQYKVSLYVKNSAGYEDTTEKIINIAPDIKPIADFSSITTAIRESENNKVATVNITNLSYSPDNDTLGNLSIYIRFDSNNDGNFNDDEWENIYNGTPIDTYDYSASSVGKYQIRVDIEEHFSNTISEFIFPSDYLSGSIIKEFEVINIAPLISSTIEQKKIVDIDISIDDTLTYTADQIQSAINSIMKPDLLAKGIETNVSVLKMEGNIKPYEGLYSGSQIEIPDVNLNSEKVYFGGSKFIVTSKNNLYNNPTIKIIDFLNGDLIRTFNFISNNSDINLKTTYVNLFEYDKENPQYIYFLLKDNTLNKSYIQCYNTSSGDLIWESGLYPNTTERNFRVYNQSVYLDNNEFNSLTGEFIRHLYYESYDFNVPKRSDEEYRKQFNVYCDYENLRYYNVLTREYWTTNRYDETIAKVNVYVSCHSMIDKSLVFNSQDYVNGEWASNLCKNHTYAIFHNGRMNVY